MKVEKLFSLTFCSDTEETAESGFHIGLFASWEEAEQVAKRYRKEVPGFKDYDCDYSIISIPLCGDADDVEKVYGFLGWNENLDETDIIISNYFVNQQEAKAAMEQAQGSVQRQEWVLNCYVIGQCDWAEGFVRCFEEESKTGG